jgi:hypothetical protein
MDMLLEWGEHGNGPIRQVRGNPTILAPILHSLRCKVSDKHRSMATVYR